MGPPEVTVLMAWALYLPGPPRGLGSIDYGWEESHRGYASPDQGHNGNTVDPGATRLELCGLTYRRIFFGRYKWCCKCFFSSS